MPIVSLCPRYPLMVVVKRELPGIMHILITRMLRATKYCYPSKQGGLILQNCYPTKLLVPSSFKAQKLYTFFVGLQYMSEKNCRMGFCWIRSLCFDANQYFEGYALNTRILESYLTYCQTNVRLKH